MGNINKKYHFIIVGSGWRSMYYVRIAKALPEVFELDAMLCRTQEKADRIAKEMDIPTTISIEECENYKPDFVVVAVNKSSIGEVSKEWMAKGVTVLCETPPTVDADELREIWRRHKEGQKLCVAEQYFRFPTYQAMLNVLDSGIIGEPYNINISLAHEYHGASLFKKILHTENETFTITGKKYAFPVKETASRYEQFTDGRVADKTRDVVTIEFESGKVAFYDFSSEQYRSGIRSHYVKVQGVNGELQGMCGSYGNFCKMDESLAPQKNHELYGGLFTEIHYMDEHNHPRKQYLVMDTRQITTGDANPNLNEYTEITGIKLGGYPYDTESGKLVYVPQEEFGLCGLAEDETAIASLMLGAAKYNDGAEELYPLKDALTDAYIAGLMQKALENPGTVIQSERQPWQK